MRINKHTDFRLLFFLMLHKDSDHRTSCFISYPYMTKFIYFCILQSINYCLNICHFRTSLSLMYL